MALAKSLFDDMEKSGAIMRGDDPRLIPTRMPIGIVPVDDILGGGLPHGTCTLIVGQESTGKTIICQYAIAAQQRTDKPQVLYLDAERTYDPDWWKLSGVDPSKLIIARPTTAEELIDLAAEALATQPELGMIVCDSLAALPPTKMVSESAERNDIGSLARLVNLLYIKIVPVLERRIFIGTNQLRENIGGYGDRYPGGLSQRYYSHVILKTRREGWITEGKERVGFNLEVSTVKNKTTAPQQTATIPFMFRGQVDMLSVAIEDAISRGTITQQLPYYTVRGKKLLGKANVRKYLSENPEILAGL